MHVCMYECACVSNKLSGPRVAAPNDGEVEVAEGEHEPEESFQVGGFFRVGGGFFLVGGGFFRVGGGFFGFFRVKAESEALAIAPAECGGAGRGAFLPFCPPPPLSVVMH